MNNVTYIHCEHISDKNVADIFAGERHRIGQNTILVVCSACNKELAYDLITAFNRDSTPFEPRPLSLWGRPR